MVDCRGRKELNTRSLPTLTRRYPSRLCVLCRCSRWLHSSTSQGDEARGRSILRQTNFAVAADIGLIQLGGHGDRLYPTRH
jgi:hypothetical protein